MSPVLWTECLPRLLPTDSTYAALEHLLKLPADPVAMRLRGGAPNDPKCILIKNASIWTADPNNPTADSLAIDEKGMVLAVGSEKIVREKLGGQAVEEVDMEGKFVCPGFVEPRGFTSTGCSFTGRN